MQSGLLVRAAVWYYSSAIDKDRRRLQSLVANKKRTAQDDADLLRLLNGRQPSINRRVRWSAVATAAVRVQTASGSERGWGTYCSCSPRGLIKSPASDRLTPQSDLVNGGRTAPGQGRTTAAERSGAQRGRWPSARRRRFNGGRLRRPNRTERRLIKFKRARGDAGSTDSPFALPIQFLVLSTIDEMFRSVWKTSYSSVVVLAKLRNIVCMTFSLRLAIAVSISSVQGAAKVAQ